MRIGYGYDIHGLVENRRLILGGVPIPFEKGLLGHSDADVLCHAISDALLGAAAIGDIGMLFPDTDPQYKNADSLKLMKQAAQKVKEAGYQISNIDVTIIAERPKLVPYRKKMIENIALNLNLQTSQVSVKATTHESFDATGSGKAIAAHAVVLLE
jgi:2-C-methyl-D-erythritol 2,4-cyclodiphosphate synthase